jgi:chromosome segregation ATPase
MSENTTKVVSARLPLGNYLQIAAAAGEKKMTVADYVLLKLYAHPDPSAQPLQQANQQIQQLNQQIAALETKNEQLATGIRNWMDETEMLKFDYDNLSKEQNQERRQIKLLSQELAQLKTQSTTLTSQLQQAEATNVALRKWMYELREALIQTHDESGSFGKMGDRYWAVVDRFIPPQE